MRYGTRTHLKRRWTPRGHRSCCPVKIGYEFGYLYTAINPYSGDLFCLMLPSMSKEWFAVFLQEFIHYSQQTHKQPSLLILDGAGSHHAEGLPLQDCLQLQHLPPASPELNPVERFFKELRRDLSNSVFENIQQVEQKIIKSLQRFWHQPSAVISLTRFPYLDPN